MGYFVVQNYQLYILQDYVGLGDDASSFVPVLGVAMLSMTLVSTLAGGPLSDRIGRRKPLIYLEAVICALGMAVPLLAPTKAGMVACIALMGFGFGLFQSVDTALVSEVLPAQETFGKVLGAARTPAPAAGTTLLVFSADGKGGVMLCPEREGGLDVERVV